MISLISGKYKGKKLYQVKSSKVRPTQAKIRKSIFQILEPFDGMKILDLYAGIGSFGFEAISRGAESTTFVEKDRQIFKILKKNSFLFIEESIKLYFGDCMKFLNHKSNIKYDIIFADPPYSVSNYNIIKEKTLSFLKPKGILCVEMYKQKIKGEVDRIKYYGDTQVVFWENKI